MSVYEKIFLLKIDFFNFMALNEVIDTGKLIATFEVLHQGNVTLTLHTTVSHSDIFII
jgi:hypothetical protein